jgi:ribosomal protein S12
MAGSEDVSIIPGLLQHKTGTQPRFGIGAEKCKETTKKTESEIAKWAKKHLIEKSSIQKYLTSVNVMIDEHLSATFADMANVVTVTCR